MSIINFKRTYLLSEISEKYENIKERATKELAKYLEYPDLIMFDDLEKIVAFFTERLIPTTRTNRPRIMFLFSNPHPYSVHQGMFLSHNTKGKENLFWPTMREAGWIPDTEELCPEQLMDFCLEVKYQGPFELLFYCYYAFPTGWQYHREYRKFRKDSLEQIKVALGSGRNVPESKNP